jgi:hypothetical protein
MDGNGDWYSHHGKQHGGSLKNSHYHMASSPTVGCISEGNEISTSKRYPMFIVA